MDASSSSDYLNNKYQEEAEKENRRRNAINGTSNSTAAS